MREGETCFFVRKKTLAARAAQRSPGPAARLRAAQ